MKRSGEIIRVKAGESVERVHDENWGELWLPTKETVQEEPARVLRVTLAPEDRLPSHLWGAWLRLAFDLCEKGTGQDKEVGLIILRSADPPHNRWRLMVPKQRVGGAALAYDMSTLRDILTGEESDGIPAGWLHAGTTHSHNTMGAFYSSTDDRDELGQPGMHVVVGSVDHDANTYAHVGSVVAARRRYSCPTGELIDLTPTIQAYHESVREIIDTKSPVRTPTVYTYGDFFRKDEKERRSFVTHGGDDDDFWRDYEYLFREEERDKRLETLRKESDPAATLTDPFEREMVEEIGLDASLLTTRAALDAAFLVLAEAEEAFEKRIDDDIKRIRKETREHARKLDAEADAKEHKRGGNGTTGETRPRFPLDVSPHEYGGEG